MTAPEPQQEAFAPQVETVMADPVMADPVMAEAAEAAPAPAMAASEPAFDPHAFGHAHHGELSVPRIGIHIYCERPDTLETAEQSSKDRRMTRASTQVRSGGLAAAVQAYQNQPTPPLVIVECMEPGPALVAKLDQLAEVCDTGTKVVVIGQHNDITLYRELMRRGVSEYLVAPLQTLQLISAITTLYADPSAPFVGRQIAFVGARGGVGSSTVAHNLAHALSEHMQSSTAIVDFDLPFGTAGLDFNQDPLQGVVDALSQPERLDPVLLDRMMVRCSERLSLFAAPATLDHDYEISADAFEEVATKVRTAAPFIVLDLPHLWSNWMRRVLLAADEVVITATPDLASLRNAKNILDLLRQARPNDTPPKLVVNQVGVPGRPEIPIKDFASALGIENPVIVPFDAKLFGQAANNGQMVGEVGPKSKPAESFQVLAQMIARREAPPAPKKSALASLFKLK
ncbi:CpaE family protein [Phenylobacterium montanum]|uniref:CpaE family protein n=2 Tax=Phenylobacterium montanum TaxID=2823693 RepID=A0A975G594_9CAUL|nr:CpaE family protein [Caulobacter sp. S6]QUD90819.1 CpaE family protein [Caulobacter sp. S6]